MSKSWPEVRNRLAAIFKDRPHRAAIAVLLLALAITLCVWLIVKSESALDTRNAYFVLVAGLAIALLLFLVVNGRRALSESEKRTRDILAAASDAFVGTDEKGVITEWNAQAEKIFGWSRTEAIGSPLAESIIPPTQREAYRRGFKRFLETGERPVLKQRIELSALRRDGSEFPIELTIWVTELGGRPSLNAFICDISARKRNEYELVRVNEQLVVSVAELEQRNRESTCLSELNNILQSCTALAEAFEPIVKTGHQLFPQEDGALYVSGHTHGEVEAAAYWGNPAILSKSRGPAMCWALRRGRLHRVDNPATGILCGHVAPETTAPYLCVPLAAQHSMLGFIHLARPAGASFDDRSEKLAMAFAEQVSLALTNLRLRETLRHESNHDPLTGLYNRRYLKNALHYELSRAKRKKTGALAVVMLDIDHFKQYNDTLGHAAGDIALQAVARLLHTNSRDYDVPCRYGGEEFVIILPDTSIDSAAKWAEKFRHAVCNLKLKQDEQALRPISVSMGVAAFPEHGDAVNTLLKSADQAMYAAKANGRNQVVIYSTTIARVADAKTLSGS